MDYRDFTALLTRIFGAFMIANVFFFYLPGSISNALPALKLSFWIFMFHAFLPSALTLLVGILLIKFPYTITNKLIKGEALSVLPNQYLLQIERIAFCVLGLFVISRSLSDLAYYLATYFWGYRLNTPFQTGEYILSPDHFGNIVGAILETIFALWLIFGAANIVKILARIRGRD